MVAGIKGEFGTIKRPDGSTIKFEVEPHRKHNLLNGLDDIGLTMQHDDAIASYETQIKNDRPWV